MRLLTIALFCGSAFSGGTLCAPGKACSVEIHLKVPEEVSAQSVRRAGGDTKASPPVLIFRGLEFGAEGFTIEVQAKPGAGSPDRAVSLGETAVVGYTRTAARAPRRKIDLPVALNDDASRLLANHSQIDITIKVIPVGELRDPVGVEAIFFQSARPQ